MKALRNVSPVSSIDDQADVGLINTEPFCERGLRDAAGGVEPPQFEDICLSDAGGAVAFSSRHALRVTAHPASVTPSHALRVGVRGGPSFSSHVGHVVVVRTQEEVVGVDTAAHVAAVQHPYAVRDRSAVPLPRQSMGERLSGAPSTEADGAVALRDASGRPQPAPVRVVRLRHFRPEPLPKRSTRLPLTSLFHAPILPHLQMTDAS